jgi:hypothetical protein
MIRRGKQEARVVVGQFGPIGFGGVSRLPRSLHYVNPSRLRVNRRTRTVRKKKAGSLRSG